YLRTNSQDTDAFLAIYEASGNLKKLVQFGSAFDDGATGVVLDGSGNIYVTGYTEGPSYFREVYELVATQQAFLEKFDSEGNAQWVRLFGALRPRSMQIPASSGPSAALGEDAAVYVAGGEDEHAFLGKYTATGEAEWFKCSEGWGSRIGADKS